MPHLNSAIIGRCRIEREEGAGRARPSPRSRTRPTRSQKLYPALTLTRLRPGVSNLQHMLPTYFSEGVLQRKLSLERFVETTSTNAAKRYGLYPKKGVIRAGSDADVVI